MKVRATVDASAITIVIVNADVKRGEKVFNAYILSSIRFELLFVGWLGYSLSALLFSIVTNGGVTSSRYACTIGAKKKGVNYFFKFFFRRGVGRVGVGVCGCGGVGRRDMDGAGWMEAG